MYSYRIDTCLDSLLPTCIHYFQEDIQMFKQLKNGSITVSFANRKRSCKDDDHSGKYVTDTI